MEQLTPLTEDERYVALSIAIVQQALSDLKRPEQLARRRVDSKYQSNLACAKRDAAAARQFLLHDLWEAGNPFGEVLTTYGARPLTHHHLVHCVETVFERGAA